MIKDIVKDQFILSQVSQEATVDDLWICEDLLDTIKVHEDQCVGMAANMIGQLKRIIIYKDGNDYSIMLNPVIIKQSEQYSCEEGCLSHVGIKKTLRYKQIKVQYMNSKFEKRVKSYSGFIAQIIQHEMDHLNGILV